MKNREIVSFVKRGLAAILAASLGCGAVFDGPCWDDQFGSVSVTAPSTECDPACGVGQVCVKWSCSWELSCDKQGGNTACTYCIWQSDWHIDPVTGAKIQDTDNYPRNGIVDCGITSTISFSITICRSPGQVVGTVTAIYDMPCSQVTPTTPWKKYKDRQLTVPDPL